MERLTTNFWVYEFVCPCCSKINMDHFFMSKLQALRNVYGKSVGIVTGGGWRCENYDPKEHGAHRAGMAADLGVPREDYHQIMRIAFDLGFAGIGVKQHGGRFKFHLDSAPEIPGVRPRPWFWTYP